jgi:hypothetical protein
MEEARWIQGFTWFGPPEHTTLRPRRRLLYCCVCVRYSSRELNLRRVVVKQTCLVLASTWAFYSLRSGSYNETQGPTGGPGAGKTLCSRTLMARSSK